MSLQEAYKNNSVLSDGLQRYYLINVFDRREDLEYTTPVELLIKAPLGSVLINKSFVASTWLQLLTDFMTFLQTNYPLDINQLLPFRTDWSRAQIFYDTPAGKNIIPVGNGVYFNLNQSAEHAVWLIGDLLNFYKIKIGYLLIHRSHIAEPEDVKKEVIIYRKNDFKNYLVSEKEISFEKADTIIQSIDILNKILEKMGGSYNNFFLFDETSSLSNYKSKLLQEAPNYTSWSEGQIKTVKKYLDFLSDYFTKVMKEAKQYKDRLEIKLN